MKLYISKILIIIVLLTIILIPNIVLAESAILENMEFFGDQLDLGVKDLRFIAVELINEAVTLLGIVCFLIIVWAGFRWMISGGNDEKIAEAKKTLTSGIIGLLLVVTSYSIANFIITSLVIATGQ